MSIIAIISLSLFFAVPALLLHSATRRDEERLPPEEKESTYGIR